MAWHVQALILGHTSLLVVKLSKCFDGPQLLDGSDLYAFSVLLAGLLAEVSGGF